MISLVTYATHSCGNFENLVNNKQGLKVNVLGFGSAWNGFTDKVKGVREFINTLDNNSIVVFLDGFDVFINVDNLSRVERVFKSFNTDIVISAENKAGYYFKKRVFLNKEKYGTPIVNSGLWMGYVHAVKKFLDGVMEDASENSDDQRLFNNVVHNNDHEKDYTVGIDSDNLLFHNIVHLKELETSQSLFVQNNGRMTFDRMGRIWKEYNSFCTFELCVACFVIGLLWTRSWKLIITLIICVAIYCLYYDIYFNHIVNMIKNTPTVS